jgi:ABC-type multidrug transport system fused ATPase/permease subunit
LLFQAERNQGETLGSVGFVAYWKMKKNSLRVYLKFARFLLPYWKVEVLIASLSLVGVGLSLIYPYLTKLVIDDAFVGRDLKLFLTLAVVGTVIFVLNSLVTNLTNYVSQYIRAKVVFDVTRRIFENLQRLPFSYFPSRSSGEHLFKVQWDIDRAVDAVVRALPQGLALIPRFVGFFIVVLFLDFRLSLFSLLLAPVAFVVPYVFTKRLRERLKAYIQSCQRVFTRLGEVFSRVYLIKAFSKEKSELGRYVEMMDENLRLKKRNIRLEVSGQFAGSLTQRAVLGLVGLYGGWRIISGDMTLGSLTAIMVYLTQLVNMQGSFAGFFQDGALNLVSCERLEPLLDSTSPSRGRHPLLTPEFASGRIDFKGVSFSYDDQRPVIDGISFTIEPGSWGALVGPSGVGKTTILNLLLRLYDAKDGVITLDGYDVTGVGPEAVRKLMGFAPQDPFLWNDTVRNNIRYGKEDATDEEIDWAARMACADEFIRNLPEGYETVVGENAGKISEGQKQRIAIARALVRKPRILIFDEAFASIDQELEKAILSHIERELSGTTVLVVTHRFSTLTQMEVIYHFESPSRLTVIKTERADYDNAKARRSIRLSLHHPSQPAPNVRHG